MIKMCAILMLYPPHKHYQITPLVTRFGGLGRILVIVDIAEGLDIERFIFLLIPVRIYVRYRNNDMPI